MACHVDLLKALVHECGFALMVSGHKALEAAARKGCIEVVRWLLLEERFEPKVQSRERALEIVAGVVPHTPQQTSTSDPLTSDLRPADLGPWACDRFSGTASSRDNFAQNLGAAGSSSSKGHCAQCPGACAWLQRAGLGQSPGGTDCSSSKGHWVHARLGSIASGGTPRPAMP